MNDLFRKSALPVILLALAGCATQGKPPPTISLDEPVQAQPLPEPPKRRWRWWPCPRCCRCRRS
jgi:hypothetical protein